MAFSSINTSQLESIKLYLLLISVSIVIGSLFISFFIAVICDPLDSKRSLYFGLGHKK